MDDEQPSIDEMDQNDAPDHEARDANEENTAMSTEESAEALVDAEESEAPEPVVITDDALDEAEVADEQPASRKRKRRRSWWDVPDPDAAAADEQDPARARKQRRSWWDVIVEGHARHAPDEEVSEEVGEAELLETPADESRRRRRRRKTAPEGAGAEDAEAQDGEEAATQDVDESRPRRRRRRKERDVVPEVAVADESAAEAEPELAAEAEPELAAEAESLEDAGAGGQPELAADVEPVPERDAVADVDPEVERAAAPVEPDGETGLDPVAEAEAQIELQVAEGDEAESIFEPPRDGDPSEARRRRRRRRRRKAHDAADEIADAAEAADEGVDAVADAPSETAIDQPERKRRRRRRKHPAAESDADADAVVEGQGEDETEERARGRRRRRRRTRDQAEVFAADAGDEASLAEAEVSAAGVEEPPRPDSTDELPAIEIEEDVDAAPERISRRERRRRRKAEQAALEALLADEVPAAEVVLDEPEPVAEDEPPRRKKRRRKERSIWTEPPEPRADGDDVVEIPPPPVESMSPADAPETEEPAAFAAFTEHEIAAGISASLEDVLEEAIPMPRETRRDKRRARREERREPRRARAPVAPEPAAAPMQPRPQSFGWRLEPPSGTRRSALEERRIKRRRRRVMGAGLLVIALGAGTALWFYDDGTGEDPRRANEDVVAAADIQPDTVTTTLIFGTREEEGDDGGAVWMTIVSHDAESEEGAVVYIPPHTAAEIPGYGLQELGSALGAGGAPLLLVSTENLLGIQIDRYIELSDADARILLEQIGTLTVDVPAELRIPIGGEEARLLLQEGRQELSPDLLTKLLFAPGLDQDDIDLGVRQLAFWDALFDSFGSEPSRLGAAVVAGETALQESDATAEEHAVFMEAMAALAPTGRDLLILPVDPLSVGGSELYEVNHRELERFVEDTIGSPVPDDEVRVQVLNGNGVPGIGEEVAQRLVGNGFRIILGGNADRLNYGTTTIVAYEESMSGHRLAEQAKTLLGVGEIKVSGQSQGIVDLTIVVGKDFLRTL